MENSEENQEILRALSGEMADAMEKAETFMVRVNSRRRQGASGEKITDRNFRPASGLWLVSASKAVIDVGTEG